MSIFLGTSEKELLKDCLQGDSSAQSRLYHRYVKAMYHTVIRIVNNKLDTEDIIQESFIKVFQSLESFKGESSLGAWIKRIVVNSALNHIRKNSRMQWVEFEDVGLYEDNELVEIPPKIDMKTIHYAIKSLPEGCRVIFSLHLLEGYQHKEIAQILDISESTSKSQYRRAKLLLRDTIKGNMRKRGV